MNMMTRWNLGNGFVPVTLHGIDDLMRTFFGQLNTDFSPEAMIDTAYPLRMEVVADENQVSAKLPLPGCKPEDFDVEVTGDELTIRARRKLLSPVGGNARFIRRERTEEEFEESVKLPAPVKGGEAKASYVDGVLTVTIPLEKQQGPRTHQIVVR